MTDLTFPNFDIGISTTNILWLALIVAVIIFGIVSAVLLYHWRKYGMGGKRFVLIESVYIIASVVFIAVAFVSILFV